MPSGLLHGVKARVIRLFAVGGGRVLLHRVYLLFARGRVGDGNWGVPEVSFPVLFDRATGLEAMTSRAAWRARRRTNWTRATSARGGRRCALSVSELDSFPGLILPGIKLFWTAC